MSKISEFVRTHDGNRYDLDGVYGAQCVDGAKEYLKYLGLPYQVPGNARDWVGSGSGGQYLISNKCGVYISSNKEGCIGIWDKHAINHGFGHVAMSYQGKWFGQNQGPSASLTSGGPFNLMNLAAPTHYFMPKGAGTDPRLELQLANGIVVKCTAKE